MSIMNVQRKNFQAGTYAPGAPAEFLKPFAEQFGHLLKFLKGSPFTFIFCINPLPLQELHCSAFVL